MKRIKSFLRETAKEVKESFFEKKMDIALQTAALNAEQEVEDAKNALATYNAEGKTPEQVVKDIVTLKLNIEKAEKALKLIQEVKEYLNEEVKE